MPLIEDLLDLEVPTSVKISPDCKQVVYSTQSSCGLKTGENNTSTLWLARVGVEKSSQQITSGQHNDTSPQWAPDGNSIAFISDRAKNGESSALYVLPLKPGGEAYAITSAENESSIEAFTFSPDGKFIAYISVDEKSAERKAKDKDKDDANVWNERLPYQRLRIVHVTTKKVTTLSGEKGHVNGFDWNENGRKIVFSTTKTPRVDSEDLYGNNIALGDIVTKEIEHIAHLPKEINDLTWVGDQLYIIGNVSLDHFSSSRTVYSLDLTSSSKKEFRRKAYGETDCAHSLTKVGREVVSIVARGLRDDVEFLGGEMILKHNTEIESFDAVSAPENDEIVLAIVQSTVGKPTEVYITTAGSDGALVQLSSHGEALPDEYEFGTSHPLECKSSDGTVSLQGIYFTPGKADDRSATRKPLPTVVLVHGGPYGRCVDSFSPDYMLWGPVLLASGYGVLVPNYRGSEGRGEAFAAAAVGGAGTVDYDDVISITQHAIEKGFADKERLVVGGWSQGGFLSYLCSVRNGMHGLGWKFKASIPGAGVADSDTMCFGSDLGASFDVELAGAAPWRSDVSQTSNRQGSAIWGFKKAMDKGDVVPPMLILHGEADERVPLHQAAMIRRALEDYGLPFEFVSYPREEHIFQERKHIVDMLERIVRWVDIYIGGKSLTLNPKA